MHAAAMTDQGRRFEPEQDNAGDPAQAFEALRIQADMAENIRSARIRQEQNMWLWGAGAAGLVVGVLLTLFLPRVLPGSVDAAVASTVMSADRWDAGISLMQSGSPEGWNNLVQASNLVRDNRAALTACAEAAAKAKKDQSCTINVSVPAGTPWNSRGLSLKLSQVLGVLRRRSGWIRPFAVV